ncbi:MAG: GNAT family N-acetyltransferase [Candidatus Latescibacteria bacterium]|nr:GNAT family N-acetyltransferase [Candidatus Latescibacterota bacterium]NIO27195.1 GNAT family N-acetyltransferase [Candidatus Latescibacterota bacterium]NIO54719.1 GNAT family N-acetyltransferase [Candidatus Latescibacterota bacterium]NIT00802.1 GNAT family N-acetyltransferase [Candidatus Latescibacterota bacterium]NIT37725.1 GNAT family N-acetyltransferase [Candidatus Latescibacterota bacterium]
MESEIKVREASAQDVDILAELWREFMDFHRGLDNFFTRSKDGHERFADFVRTNIDSSNWLILVAVDGGKPIGYCMATIMDYPPVLEIEQFGFIQDIAVAESHRGKGVGTLLFKRVESWLKERGIGRIELQVASTNEASQAFWKQLGFGDFLNRLAKNL